MEPHIQNIQMAKFISSLNIYIYIFFSEANWVDVKSETGLDF